MDKCRCYSRQERQALEIYSFRRKGGDSLSVPFSKDMR